MNAKRNGDSVPNKRSLMTHKKQVLDRLF